MKLRKKIFAKKSHVPCRIGIHRVSMHLIATVRWINYNKITSRWQAYSRLVLNCSYLSLFEVCNFSIDAAVKNLSPSMFHYQNNDLCKWKKMQVHIYFYCWRACGFSIEFCVVLPTKIPANENCVECIRKHFFETHSRGFPMVIFHKGLAHCSKLRRFFRNRI